MNVLKPNYFDSNSKSEVEFAICFALAHDWLNRWWKSLFETSQRAKETNCKANSLLDLLLSTRNWKLQLLDREEVEKF